MRLDLDPELSAQVIAGCKSRKMTFGTVLPVLAQVSLAKLLFSSDKYRDDPEWERRLRSPWNIGAFSYRSSGCRMNEMPIVQADQLIFAATLIHGKEEIHKSSVP